MESEKIYPLSVELAVWYHSDVTAGSVINWLSKQTKCLETNVSDAANNTYQEYYAVVEFFKELDRLNLGKFIVGRKGHESRIIWNYTTESICSVAKEHDTELVPISKLDRASFKRQSKLSSHNLINHEFLLRENLPLKFSLPKDFHRKDCERLSKWLNTLPLD